MPAQAKRRPGFARIVLILFALILVAAAGFVAWAYFTQYKALSQPGDTGGWKTYTSTQYGYEIKYPADWQVETDAQASTAVSFTINQVTQLQISGRSKLSLEQTVSYESDKNISMGTYAKRVASQPVCAPASGGGEGCAPLFPDVKRIMPNGAPGYWSQQPGSPSATAAFGIKKHDLVIEISDSQPDLKLFEQIVSTFRLTD